MRNTNTEPMDLVQEICNQINQQNLWEKTVDLERNEYLKVSGSLDTRVYFVLSGSLRMFVVDEYEEHTIRFGYQNNLIADLAAFITDSPSDLFIQAIKKTQLKAINKADFMGLIGQSPENIELWQRILYGIVYQQMERERDILTSSPAERYRRVFARSPHLFQEIPSKYIASYLRMSPETLSRIKKS